MTNNNDETRITTTTTTDKPSVTALIGDCCEAVYSAAGIDTREWEWFHVDDADDETKCARCGQFAAAVTELSFYRSIADAINDRAERELWS